MKRKIILIGSFAAVFLIGMAVMRWWDQRTTQAEIGFAQDDLAWLKQEVDSAQPAKESTEETAEESAEEPTVSAQQDVQEAAVADEAKNPAAVSSSTVSHLAPVHLPEIQTIISRSGATYEVAQDAEQPNKIKLKADPANELPSELQGVSPQPRESNIVMIAAPVQPLLIKTLEEYKTFKKRALGRYPAANFSKENVLVLESTSNLPDKVFEILHVQEQDGKRVVSYRVNVFGLDQKTNSHSAVLLPKDEMSLELKQVL